MRHEKDMTICIGNSILEQMKKCVKRANPNEASGLIFGHIKEVLKGNENNNDFEYRYISEKFQCVESDSKSPVSFLIENTEKLDEILQNATKKYNLRVLSIFHSHPSGSHPSGFDTNYMEYLDSFENKIFKNLVWIIMDASSNELNAFIYLKEEFLQINVEKIQ